jgi:Mal s 1 allergenic protein-like
MSRQSRTIAGVLLVVLPTGAFCLLAASPQATGSSGQGFSKWVSVDDQERLRYATDERGNRVMDFSHAGYGGGGVALPDVQVARSIEPVTGDNTARIQAAVDEVSRLGADSRGFRGAVLLTAGTFDIAGTLRISTSGVVLRGSGSGASGTLVRVTGTPHRFLEIAGHGTWQLQGEPARVTSRYVPAGTVEIEVDNPAGFAVGDSILVRRPVTGAWIRFMGMDTLSRDGQPQTWIKPGTIIDTDRTIAAISGRRVTLDVPLSDSLDAAHLEPPGPSIVKYAFPGRIEQVGFERMRVAAPPQDVPIDRAQYTLLRMNALRDGWVRDIVVDDTHNTIVIGGSAKRVTLDNVRIRHAVPFTAPASPADIAISGTQVLVHRSTVTGRGVWPVVTQAGVTGPNVVLHFTSDQAGVAPHQRWATGLLVDSSEFTNGTERRPNVAFSNREHAGSGHGWSVGWAVAWNVKADYVLIQQPPGAKNWCIGCSGRPPGILWHGNPIAVPPVPSETFESPGVAVTPMSLYLHQLQDRLGARAIANIGYGPSIVAKLPALPGRGLAQHSFLYCGEWQRRSISDQTMYIVRGGRVVWSYTNPHRGELGDCSMLANGNILFSRQFGASEITPDQQIVWNYDGPPGTEIHTTWPVDRDRVLIMQNGNPARALIIHKRTNRIERSIVLPTRNGENVHGQFRHVRLTPDGHFLVAHLDLGKVVEYDQRGQEIWSVPAPSAWAAVRLKNGNILISGNQHGYVREVNRQGSVVWEIDKDDLPDIPLHTVQEVTRLANGNTLINNWVGGVPHEEWPRVVQLIEVTPAKSVVWALRDWMTLGPASSTQLLDEPGSAERRQLQR